MKSYYIQLIRNGLTEGNVSGKYVGHIDEPLSSEGIAQIEQMKNDYKYPPVDAVFASPLSRCTQTAKIIYPNCEPIVINGLIEYKDNIRKIKTNDSLYGLVNIVQSLNLVPKTWKKVSAMHISDNYGNVLRIYSNNMDSENVFYVIDFYLGGTKISDKGSEVSPDFSSKLCLNLMTNLIVPLETAISSVNIWHTPDTSHAIGISKSKFYDLNYLHYACNSCGQDEACAISVIFKY